VALLVIKYSPFVCFMFSTYCPDYGHTSDNCYIIFSFITKQKLRHHEIKREIRFGYNNVQHALNSFIKEFIIKRGEPKTTKI